MLPFIEETSPFARFDFHYGYDSVANRVAAGTIISVYNCPSTTTLAFDRHGDTTGDVNGNGQWDPGDGLAFIDYGGNFGFSGFNNPYMNGVLIYEQSIAIAKIRDGTSHTIIVSEDTSGRPPTTANGPTAKTSTTRPAPSTTVRCRKSCGATTKCGAITATESTPCFAMDPCTFCSKK